jgi:transcriptional antiterminator NusG
VTSTQKSKASKSTAAPSATKQWYVLNVYSGSEHQVLESIKETIARHTAEFQDKFGEILVPTEEVVEMKLGKKRQTERKFYPGYIFINMVMDDETWHLVNSVSKVTGFVGGTKGKPKPISEKDAERMLQRVQESAEKPRPKILFEPGEVVRVVSGPFADFNGVVEEVNYEKNRLRVAVLIFGRSTPVELEFSQVAKA